MRFEVNIFVRRIVCNSKPYSQKSKYQTNYVLILMSTYFTHFYWRRVEPRSSLTP